MDGQRLHPHLRRPAPDRGGARRPFRPAAPARDRPDDLHRSVGRGGARPDDRRARRGPRRPGARRRDRDAAHADDSLERRPGRTPRRRARGLGRHQRPRGRVRAAGWWGGRVRDQLALDLLAQRPDRARARAARPVPPRREPRAVESARPSRTRARRHRPARHRLGARPRQRPRLGLARDRRLDRRRASSFSASSSSWELRSPGADAADALLREPRFRARERGVALLLVRDVRLDLLAGPVLLPERSRAIRRSSPA